MEIRPIKITGVVPKIVRLGCRNSLLVEVHTDEGLIGLGETVMERRTLTAKQNVEEIKPYRMGRDPLRIEDLWEKLYRDSVWVGGPLHATAIRVLDAALWDI